MTDGLILVRVEPLEHVDLAHVGGGRWNGRAIVATSEWGEGVLAVVVEEHVESVDFAASEQDVAVVGKVVRGAGNKSGDRFVVAVVHENVDLAFFLKLAVPPSRSDAFRNLPAVARHVSANDRYVGIRIQPYVHRHVGFPGEGVAEVGSSACGQSTAEAAVSVGLRGHGCNRSRVWGGLGIVCLRL